MWTSSDIYIAFLNLVTGPSLIAGYTLPEEANQRRSKLHESEGRVQFDVFEKLTSVCFFKLHEKPYYYLLIIYMKKIRVSYIFICWQSSAISMRNLKSHSK